MGERQRGESGQNVGKRGSEQEREVGIWKGEQGAGEQSGFDATGVHSGQLGVSGAERDAAQRDALEPVGLSHRARSLQALRRKASRGLTCAGAQCRPAPLSRACITTLLPLSTIPEPIGQPAA